MLNICLEGDVLLGLLALRLPFRPDTGEIPRCTEQIPPQLRSQWRKFPRRPSKVPNTTSDHLASCIRSQTELPQSPLCCLYTPLLATHLPSSPAMLRSAIPRSSSTLSQELRLALPAVVARRTFATSRTATSPLKQAQIQHISASKTRAFATTSKMAANTRAETDAFGEVHVASDRYWGAQTERSLGNFNINQPQDRMPPPIVRAFGILKGAAATVNMRYGLGRFG